MHLGAATGIDECLNDPFALFELVVVVVAALLFFGTVEDDFAKTMNPSTVATMR